MVQISQEFNRRLSEREARAQDVSCLQPSLTGLCLYFTFTRQFLPGYSQPRLTALGLWNCMNLYSRPRHQLGLTPTHHHARVTFVDDLQICDEPTHTC
jgi:hypothetical protein